VEKSAMMANSAPNQIKKKQRREQKMTTQLLGYLADPTQQTGMETVRTDKTDTYYFVRQKLMGFAMLITGIVAPIVSTEGVTASLFCVPFGLALIATKGRMMTE
jgi:hypothetical protein